MKRNKTTPELPVTPPRPTSAADDMTVFNMRISNDRYSVLREIASKEDRTIASLVRLLVEDGLRYRALELRKQERAPAEEAYRLPGEA
jgi:hypothetical protein